LFVGICGFNCIVIDCTTGRGEPAALLKKAVETSGALEKWNSTKCLIIDEISMVDRPMLELLDAIARHMKKVDAPFGGLHVVVVGDFLQLPPVPRQTGSAASKAVEYCFQSPVWKEAGFARPGTGAVYLKQVERQKDRDFVGHLNQVRVGVGSEALVAMLNECLISKKPLPNDGVLPTKLYCRNVEVDSENQAKLAELEGEVHVCEAADNWRVKPINPAIKSTHFTTLLDAQAPASLELKVGAQVMLTRNRNKGSYAVGGVTSTTSSSSSRPSLVNGSRGKVIGFSESALLTGTLHTALSNIVIARLPLIFLLYVTLMFTR
jgi:ATP-dependent DNA helicase PIF1